jgi:hypothetical protein
VATFGDGLCTDCKARPKPAPTAAPQAPATSSSPVGLAGRMVPTGNKPALVAYYLSLAALTVGAFALLRPSGALVPAIGIAVGAVAVLCGLLGLRLQRENAAARGGGHAWFGLVLGGLSAIAQAALIAAPSH